MAKHSTEFKIKVAREYQEGRIGYRGLAKKYGIPKTCIEERVAIYNKFGEEGLKRSRKKAKYTFEFKKNMVELYETSELSYKELALAIGITNPSMVAAWVSRYRAVGNEGLLPQKRGRPSKLKKENKSIPSSQSNKDILSSDEAAKKLAQLEQENLKLRIENAYLKN